VVGATLNPRNSACHPAIGLKGLHASCFLALQIAARPSSSIIATMPRGLAGDSPPLASSGRAKTRMGLERPAQGSAALVCAKIELLSLRCCVRDLCSAIELQGHAHGPAAVVQGHGAAGHGWRENQRAVGALAACAGATAERSRVGVQLTLEEASAAIEVASSEVERVIVTASAAAQHSAPGLPDGTEGDADHVPRVPLRCRAPAAAGRTTVKRAERAAAAEAIAMASVGGRAKALDWSTAAQKARAAAQRASEVPCNASR
jgi:hypothetical protein